MNTIQKKYPHIFEPLTIGNVTFKNRVFSAPSMGHMIQNNAPTYPEPAMIKNYLEKAKGGVAQVECGGQVGCETGVHYATRGHEVTILKMKGEICPDATRTYREELQGQVSDHCKVAITGGTCTGITSEGVSYRDEAGNEHIIPADTVILALGMRSLRQEAEAFRGCATGFTAIGDCVKVGNVQKAVRAGYDAAMCLGG